jgi:hypothetical protein
MSVISHPDELVRWLGLRRPIKGCFWCRKPLDPIIVFFHASIGDLALHPACAEAFGSALISDGRRAGMGARGQNPTAGVVVRSPRNSKVVELRRWRGSR